MRHEPKEWLGMIRSNTALGGGLYKLELALPARFPKVKAGAFVMLSVQEEPRLLLRRPMAIFDFKRTTKMATTSILYSVVGAGTLSLSTRKKGALLSLLAPIGNSFSVPKNGQPIAVVAGGIGIAPFLLWARQAGKKKLKNARFYFGFRDLSQTKILSEFRALGISPLISVDRGKGPFRGNVVERFRKDLKIFRPNYVYTCGPPRMLEALTNLLKKERIPGEMSIEAKMGCGLGACLSCVTPNFSLVCRDGPIFQIFESQQSGECCALRQHT